MSTNNDYNQLTNSLNRLKDASETTTIGKIIASGIGVGIDEYSYVAITAMRHMYVELDKISDDAHKNAEALEKKQAARSLANLKNALKLNLITEQEYYEKLKEYRDTHLTEADDEWYKYTEDIIFYNKRLADKALEEQERIEKGNEKLLSQMGSVRDKLFAKLVEVRSELEEKLQLSDIDWFSSHKVTFKNMGTRGQDLVYNIDSISNFQDENALIEQYKNAILALNELGNIPKGVFSDISQMSIEEGLSAANAILSASAFERDRFIEGYNKRNTLASGATDLLLPLLNEAEINRAAMEAADAFNKAYFNADSPQKNAFITLLEESFSSVPDSYYTLGLNSAESFENGFVQSIPDIMSTISSYVQNNANAFISGFLQTPATVVAAGSSSGNTYNNNYVFNTSRDTTTQQLFAARRATILSRLRGYNER